MKLTITRENLMIKKDLVSVESNIILIFYFIKFNFKILLEIMMKKTYIE